MKVSTVGKSLRLWVLLPAVLLLLPGLKEENPRRIVSADLKTLDGKNTSSDSFANGGKPMILVFWVSFHKNPTLELEAIAENYDSWHTETGVKVIAVAVDDSRTSANVAPKVAAREWPFEFYLDPNQEFQRAMNVNFVPHTFIINGAGEVTWEKEGYVAGDENSIHEQLILCTD